MSLSAALVVGLAAGDPAAADASPAGDGADGSVLTGPQIEQLLRTNLGAAPGSGIDTSQIRCPATRAYGDGDVARCSVPVGSGATQILLITVFKENSGWRFVVGLQ